MHWHWEVCPDHRTFRLYLPTYGPGQADPVAYPEVLAFVVRPFADGLGGCTATERFLVPWEADGAAVLAMLDPERYPYCAPRPEVWAMRAALETLRRMLGPWRGIVVETMDEARWSAAPHGRLAPECGAGPEGQASVVVPVYRDRGRRPRGDATTEVVVRAFGNGLGVAMGARRFSVPWKAEVQDVLPTTETAGCPLLPDRRPLALAIAALSRMLVPWWGTCDEPMEVAEWRADEQFRRWSAGLGDYWG